MTAAARIARLRAVNPAAVRLASACALAARVEPDLLRALRLLVPGADAATEADLWFSDLVAGRDPTAMALDPLVAQELRDELRSPDQLGFLDAAVAEISVRHGAAHWSVRLEERIHHLDVAAGPGADDEIDDLMLAAADQLGSSDNATGIARWLFGAAGRLPSGVADRVVARAGTVAAALHLDRDEPATSTLTAGESQAWLPWLLGNLPTVPVGVSVVDGSVVLDSPEGAVTVQVPDTDPLVVEVRWTDGVQARSRRVRFRTGDPVRIETGAPTATVVTLAGTGYELADATAPAPAGLNFGRRKQSLRPCLGRDGMIDELVGRVTSAKSTRTVITGYPGEGKSTLLTAVADRLAAERVVVVEHYFAAGAPDDPAAVERSCLAQLAAAYPTEGSDGDERDGDLGRTIEALAERGVFSRRPLVFVLDDLRVLDLGQYAFPRREISGVHLLLSGATRLAPPEATDRPWHQVVLTGTGGPVCEAMIERERDALTRAFAGPVEPSLLIDLSADPTTALAGLTATERRVAVLAGRGLTNRETAQSLGLTVKTVESFVTSVYRKLDIRSRGELSTLMAVPGNPGRLAAIIAWISRQPADSVTARRIPPTLAAGFRVEQPEAVLYDLLRAAHGRNTRGDCAEAAESSPDVEPGAWQQFWPACVGANIVLDTDEDGIVTLTAPEAADVLLAQGRPGDRLLGVRHEEPWDFAMLASPTRLSAAVGHALAVNQNPMPLCTDLSVLRRRYAQDREGLLADLAAVGADSLRAAVSGIAVAPADFLPALHDRLAARGDLDLVPGLAEHVAAGPMRVRTVRDEQDLLASAVTDRHPGPALAIVARGTDVGLIVRQEVPRTEHVEPVLTVEDLVGAHCTGDGFAAWTAASVWFDFHTEVISKQLPLVQVTRIGPLAEAVARAWRLPEAVVVAGHDGSVTAYGVDRQPLMPTVPGQGAAVTVVTDTWFARTASDFGATEIRIGYADGTVRTYGSDFGDLGVHSGHRGAVTCLADLQGHYVSGGEDGCLLYWNRFGELPSRRHQYGAPITCLDVLGERVVFGAADGTVHLWHPETGERVPLGSHDEAVHGLAVPSETEIVSWADTVRFWNPRTPGVVRGHATGFPSGVRQVLVGERDLAVLCGDGSVQRRTRPGTAQTRTDYRGCLAVSRSTVYLGLSDGVTTADGGTSWSGGPFTDVAAGGALVLLRTPDGRIRYGERADPPPAGAPAGAELLAMSRSTLVTATDRTVDVWSIGAVDAFSRTATRLLPDVVTRVAIGEVVAIGMANGDVRLHSTHSGRLPADLLTGTGSPVSALAALDNGTVVAGTSAGDLRCWPAGVTAGMSTVRRGSAITGLAAAGWQVVTAEANGTVALWQTAPLRLVREIDLGAPIRALAADGGLVAARDAHGRLWTFEVDPLDQPMPNLDVRIINPSGPGGPELLLSDPSAGYEITAVRLTFDGAPVALRPAGHWPPVRPDGTLLVPFAPHVEMPLRLSPQGPLRLAPDMPIGPSEVIVVEVDLAGRVPGHRYTLAAPMRSEAIA